MANRLSRESSPYLLQHQNNPVDWYPWGPEALEKARKENRPIFLSIGYAACHWCHVMERESFEDEETAGLMNRLFINIKVDREERPDLDDIYMQAVVAMTGQGGWPMSVFLTPAGEPFYGGTYFPPDRRYNIPAFREVLTAVARAWDQDRENILAQAGRLSDHLQQELGGVQGDDAQWDQETLDQAALKLTQNYDWTNGGWGKAPKFPQPMAIEFLLQRAAKGDNLALEIARHALDSMAAGGMYDVVGGGFARYSVDDQWLVPHFEKMLYDNAQLARVYLYAWLLTGKQRYREVVEETLDFIMREMTHPTGGFFSSLDADSEGEEGKFYVWLPEEISEAVGDPNLSALVVEAYGVTEKGNFEGRTILQRAKDDDSLAELFAISSEEVHRQLRTAHDRMLTYRSRRVRPATDDKCVTAWNGLMLMAFSEAGRYLKNDRYADMAMRNGDFLLSELQNRPGQLLRTWRNGQPGPAGFLEDYGAAALGLLSLYQSAPHPKWFSTARQLVDQMIENFSDPNGGFFDTGADQEKLLVRPKNVQDNATPSGNSLAARALILMAAYTGDHRYRAQATQALSPIQAPAARYPTAFANWLCAADLTARALREVVLTGPSDPSLQPFQSILNSTFRPHLVTATVTGEPISGLPPLAMGRTRIENQATAYICEGFVCRQPTTDPDTFASQLKSD